MYLIDSNILINTSHTVLYSIPLLLPPVTLVSSLALHGNKGLTQ